MIHNKIKKFVCVVCQKKVGKKYYLTNHTERIHNVSKTIQKITMKMLNKI